MLQNPIVLFHVGEQPVLAKGETFDCSGSYSFNNLIFHGRHLITAKTADDGPCVEGLRRLAGLCYLVETPAMTLKDNPENSEPSEKNHAGSVCTRTGPLSTKRFFIL